jgi:hypothetical protein
MKAIWRSKMISCFLNEWNFCTPLILVLIPISLLSDLGCLVRSPFCSKSF